MDYRGSPGLSAFPVLSTAKAGCCVLVSFEIRGAQHHCGWGEGAGVEAELWCCGARWDLWLVTVFQVRSIGVYIFAQFFSLKCNKSPEAPGFPGIQGHSPLVLWSCVGCSAARSAGGG